MWSGACYRLAKGKLRTQQTVGMVQLGIASGQE